MADDRDRNSEYGLIDDANISSLSGDPLMNDERSSDAGTDVSNDAGHLPRSPVNDGSGKGEGSHGSPGSIL